MLKSFSILLSILVCITPMQNLVSYVFFTLNQRNFEVSFCVIKLNTTKKCNGKCYLKKQLSKTEKEKDSPSFLELSRQDIQWIPLDLVWQDKAITYKKKIRTIFFLNCNGFDFQPGIYHPPKIFS